MTNREIALTLFNIATMLDLADGNPYRIRAYRRAARSLLRLPHELGDLSDGQTLPIEGLGKRLRAKIGELASQGRMAFYDELIAEQPPAIQALMRVPGVGPKTAFRLFYELHLTSPADLLAAARGGRIKELWGFGERRERALEQAAAEVIAAGSTDGPDGAPALLQAA